jgi:hypothetical protein
MNVVLAILQSPITNRVVDFFLSEAKFLAGRLVAESRAFRIPIGFGHSNLLYCRSWLERIHHGDTGVAEIGDVPGGDRKAMLQSRGSDQAVLDRHCQAIAT